ncbi:MAG: tail fiber protein [Actinomycetota bacterium]|nr:tail fiber protein [Actinomycetota bacterium]
MSDPFLGEIRLVPYNFAPRGWAFCQGQILAISQNTALFSLLGTTYGGNGQTTFALPDLRGRGAVSSGQGPGLSNISLGQVAGSETVTLTQGQMPAHGHLAGASNGAAGGSRPAGQVPAAGGAYAASSDGSTLNPAFIQNTGGSQPFPIRSPYLGLNYIIALEGIFPSRN